MESIMAPSTRKNQMKTKTIKRSTAQLKATPGITFTVVYWEDFFPVSADARACEFESLEDAERMVRDWDESAPVTVVAYDAETERSYHREPDLFTSGIWECFTEVSECLNA